MKTKTYTVYKFDELSEESQEKVIDKYRQGNLEFDWYQFNLDEWKEKLEKIGFLNADIRFSGFWSQGDGASFTADIDELALIDHLIMCSTDYQNARKLDKLYQIHNEASLVSITLHLRYSNYFHENTVSVNIDLDIYSTHALWIDLQKFLEESVDDLRRDLCHAIYHSLETEYDWLQSDEQIIESIRANDYDFTEYGVID